jgi:hypothetical protein
MIRAAERWLHAPATGHRVAAFRILFALYLLAYFGSMLPHVPLLFSNQGVYTPYLFPDYAPAPALAWVLFAIMMLADVALLIGYRSELSARLMLLLFLYHYFLQIAVKQSSFDRLIVIYLVILCFADAGRVWGLDRRRAAGAAPSRWAERLLVMQTLMLYFGSGLWKAFNPAWHTGELLRSTLQSVWASPIAFAIVQQDFSEHTWTLFSRGIIAFELLIAPLLLARRTRPLGIAFGVGFHLFNTIVVVVPEFLVAATPYPLFIEPATLRRAVARCSSLLPRLRLATKRGDDTTSD